MPSHMSSIGFNASTMDEFARLARQAVQAGQVIPVPEVGSYRYWSPGAGVELWAQVNQEGAPVGLNPHFGGEARMLVGLLKRIVHLKDTALDGAFLGWANPLEEGEGEGEYPFCFNSPDYRMQDKLTMPRILPVQLAGFAQDLEAFPSEAEMRSSGGWMKDMSVESCIPSGTFVPGQGPIDPPEPEVILCGTVLETSRRTNPVTGLSFFWARVRTLGGELDVVADQEIVKGTIVRNGVVGGTFWLSGRVKQA